MADLKIAERCFSLRVSRFRSSFGGRPTKPFRVIPEKIEPLKAQWISSKISQEKPKLIRNIPIEYLGILAHADSDTAPVLLGTRAASNSTVEFIPALRTKKMEFSMVDLFCIQLNPQNSVATKFSAFSADWFMKISGLPLRSSEIYSLLCIYPFIEIAVYLGHKYNLSDLILECIRKKQRRDYVQALYSLIVLSETELAVFDKCDKVIIPKKRLFEIKSVSENTISLANILENPNSNTTLLFEILKNFTVDLSNGALGDIERQHRTETMEIPQEWKASHNNKKPHFWHKKIFKGGHLFHCPHPQLNLDLSYIRCWAVFSAFQPRMNMGLSDCTKEFALDSFAAIIGFSKIKEKRRTRFLEMLKGLAGYWGAITISCASELQIRYGYDKKIEQMISEKEKILSLDLQYGTVEVEILQKITCNRLDAYIFVSDQKLTGTEIKVDTTTKPSPVDSPKEENLVEGRSDRSPQEENLVKSQSHQSPQEENPPSNKSPKEENFMLGHSPQEENLSLVQSPQEDNHSPQEENYHEKPISTLHNSHLETVFRNGKERNCFMTRNRDNFQSNEIEKNLAIASFRGRINQLIGKVRPELIEIANNMLVNSIAKGGKLFPGVMESLISQLERTAK